MNSARWIGILIAAALLAGCASDEPQAAAADEEALDEEGSVEEEVGPTIAIVVHESTDEVAGVAPTDPTRASPLVENLPPAKVATFEVANGSRNLRAAVNWAQGAGMGRIVIHDPAGTAIYATQIQVASGAASVVLQDGREMPGGVAMPGTYEIRYYVTGAFNVGILVEADVPAPPGTGAEPQPPAEEPVEPSARA